MKKVAFYLDNSTIADVAVNSPDDGNPGIGGTEYLFILIASKLAEHSDVLDVKFFVRQPQGLPPHLDVSVVSSIEEAIRSCEDEGRDYLVVKHVIENVTTPVLSSDKGLKFIVWCHVFACHWELDAYSGNNSVARIIFVSRETMQLYLDHPVMRKSSFIFNAVPLKGCREAVAANPPDKRGHIVTYVGSLVPFKGFHLLAGAWKDVLRAVPDAELFIIGSGRVYDSGAKMGKHGIAEEKYENLIFSHLEEDGGLLPGVHFMGRMGKEKNEILLKTKVGVPNPSGVTETFCLSAVEMQSLGAAVATIKAPGYIDTVKNGVLYSRPSQLSRTIISLLKSNDGDYDTAMSYFEDTFSVDVIVSQWEKLLTGKADTTIEVPNGCYRLKWLKNFIRKISKFIPVNRVLPPVERLLIFYERKIRHKVTFMDSNINI